MVEMLSAANWLLPLLYLALLIRYAAAFFLRTRAHGRSLLLLVVLVLHVLFLVDLALFLHRPVPGNSFELLSVLAAATAMVDRAVEYASQDRRTGVFVLLAAFLLQYTASVCLPQWDLSAPPRVAEQQHGLHILPAIVAYTAFTISAIYAVLHLLARRDIKQRRFGILFDRLPSLELLGKMSWHALLTGFVFLTIAIISGAAMSLGSGLEAIHGMDARTLIKVFAGSVAWIVFAGAIVGRFLHRWDAAYVSRVTLVGFCVVVAMLVASVVLS